MKKYYPVPMHIHSVWERNASMEGHFYNAQKLGIKHMYITDHDVRMGPRENHISGYDFSKAGLFTNEPSPDPRRPRWHGFKEIKADEGTSYFVADGMLMMEAQGGNDEWTELSLVFDTSQKRHEYALLANVILNMYMQVSAEDEDSRAVVDVELSQRPPNYEFGHIKYVFGNAENLGASHTAIIPVTAKEGLAEYVFELLADAQSVGGGDNVLRRMSLTLSARRGKKAELKISKFSLSWDIEFEEGRRAQQRLADELGKKYGVKAFVTSEITGAGPHKNCFSTCVPVINYRERNFCVTDEQAMEHVREYGGIYSRNHPFEELKDRFASGITEQEKQELIDAHICRFIENKAWDATLLEVGFPQGREGFTPEIHLKLWDALSAAGVFITGYGDSDNHTNNTSWFDGNNFVAYIAAQNPCEEEFVSSMKRGDIYTGDPVYLQKMNVTFEGSGGQQMGQVDTGENSFEVILSLTNVPEGCTVVWIANGEEVKREKCRDDYRQAIGMPDDGKVNFVRVAIYKEERLIMLTNPIYKTNNSEIIKTIPKERRINDV